MPRFRVLAGVHSEGGRTYYKGDIVDRKSDLNRLNSPGSLKFEHVPDEPKRSSKDTARPRADRKSTNQ